LDKQCRGGEVCIDEKCLLARSVVAGYAANFERGAFLKAAASASAACQNAADAKLLEKLVPNSSGVPTGSFYSDICTGSDATKTAKLLELRNDVKEAARLSVYPAIGANAAAATVADRAVTGDAMPTACTFCSMEVPQSVTATFLWPGLTLALYANSVHYETGLLNALAAKLSADTATTVAATSIQIVKKVEINVGGGGDELSIELEVNLEHAVTRSTSTLETYAMAPKDDVSRASMQSAVKAIGADSGSRITFMNAWKTAANTAAGSSLADLNSASLSSVTVDEMHGSTNAYKLLMQEATAAAASRTLAAAGGYSGLPQGATLAFAGGLYDGYMCFRHKTAEVTAAPTCLAEGTSNSIVTADNDATKCTSANGFTLIWTDQGQTHLRWIHCINEGDTSSSASADQLLS
jgi:hypothetical protein